MKVGELKLLRNTGLNVKDKDPQLDKHDKRIYNVTGYISTYISMVNLALLSIFQTS